MRNRTTSSCRCWNGHAHARGTAFKSVNRGTGAGSRRRRDTEDLVDLALRQVRILLRGRDDQPTRPLDLFECLVVAEATVQGLGHPGLQVVRSIMSRSA